MKATHLAEENKKKFLYSTFRGYLLVMIFGECISGVCVCVCVCVCVSNNSQIGLKCSLGPERFSKFLSLS
jgi:urea transporter